jgi:hypothetical protein
VLVNQQQKRTRFESVPAPSICRAPCGFHSEDLFDMIIIFELQGFDFRKCPCPGSARVRIMQGPCSRQVRPVRLNSLRVTESRGLTIPSHPLCHCQRMSSLGLVPWASQPRTSQTPFCFKLMIASFITMFHVLIIRYALLRAPFFTSVNGKLSPSRAG